MGLWDLGVATIFAREFLEASIIIGQYRTVITKSNQWMGEKENAALRTVTSTSVIAIIVACLTFISIIVPLEILSQEFDTHAANIIEGVSKVVAAICILQLSLKIPKFMGFYPPKKNKKAGDTLKEIRFNVAWNIWREAAECFVFIIPYILDRKAEEIPLSALAGSVIALILGGLIYYGNKHQESKLRICVFMIFLLCQLAIGLFTGGCHKLEIAWGETPTVWTINGAFWDDSKVPMGIVKPFGYSSTRTVLQICCFWGFVILSASLHYYKYKQAENMKHVKFSQTDLTDSDIENLNDNVDEA